jgi:hypothetical protein
LYGDVLQPPSARLRVPRDQNKLNDRTADAGAHFAPDSEICIGVKNSKADLPRFALLVSQKISYRNPQKINNREGVMALVRRRVFNTAAKLAGNRFVQRLLETNVQIAQALMGVGTGAGVFSSGEDAIFEVLKHRYKPPYCIFDVAANKGQFLNLILNNLSLDEISVHCFEFRAWKRGV